MKYKDIDAKCPFFDKGDSRYIQCEGITSKCATRLLFRDSEHGNFLPNDRYAYSDAFCNADYEKCLVYKMLNSKYDEVKE